MINSLVSDELVFVFQFNTISYQERVQDFSQEGCTTKKWSYWLVRETNFKSENQEASSEGEGCALPTPSP